MGTVRAPRACRPEQALPAFLGMELLHNVGWRSSQGEKEALAPAFEMRILGGKSLCDRRTAVITFREGRSHSHWTAEIEQAIDNSQVLLALR